MKVELTLFICPHCGQGFAKEHIPWYVHTCPFCGKYFDCLSVWEKEV